MVILSLLLPNGFSCLGSHQTEKEKKKNRERKEKVEEVWIWERGRAEMTNRRWRSNPRQETSKQYFSRCWKRSLGGGFTHSGKKI